MIEWGIQYEDETPYMDGPRMKTFILPNEEVARDAATWSHRPWDSRDVTVVYREVGEWTKAQ